MREIVFIGKRCDNGEWVAGNLIHRKIWSSELYIIRVEDNGFDSYVEYEVIPETVGQYTGLKDKNGIRIFEGDICKNTENDNTAVVRWYEEHTAYLLYSRSKDILYWLYDNDFSKIEVIGNIHDNPELLEVQE